MSTLSLQAKQARNGMRNNSIVSKEQSDLRNERLTSAKWFQSAKLRTLLLMFPVGLNTIKNIVHKYNFMGTLLQLHFASSVRMLNLYNIMNPFYLFVSLDYVHIFRCKDNILTYIHLKFSIQQFSQGLLCEYILQNIILKQFHTCCNKYVVPRLCQLLLSFIKKKQLKWWAMDAKHINLHEEDDKKKKNSNTFQALMFKKAWWNMPLNI